MFTFETVPIHTSWSYKGGYICSLSYSRIEHEFIFVENAWPGKLLAVRSHWSWVHCISLVIQSLNFYSRLQGIWGICGGFKQNHPEKACSGNLSCSSWSLNNDSFHYYIFYNYSKWDITIIFCCLTLWLYLTVTVIEGYQNVL